MIKNWQQSFPRLDSSSLLQTPLTLDVLFPQIVYYVYAYAALVRQNKIEAGQEINIVVPTGNFGNHSGSIYAKHDRDFR